MRETDLIKKIYILKKMNEIRLNKIYVENRLKCFKIRKMQAEMLKKNQINKIFKKR